MDRYISNINRNRCREYLPTSLSASLNVLGNILGKSFKNTGNVNSMNGTIINTEKGTSRNKSATVRAN